MSEKQMGYWERAVAERVGAQSREDLWRRIGLSCGTMFEPFEITAQPLPDGRIPHITLTDFACDCGAHVPRGSASRDSTVKFGWIARCAVCLPGDGNIRAIDENTFEMLRNPPAWVVTAMEGT